MIPEHVGTMYKILIELHALSRYLFHTCSTSPTDHSSNITKLHAFLDGRLGASTSAALVEKVRDGVVTGRRFQDVVTDIAGDIMDYFPLVIQLVQLEVFSGNRE